MGYFHGVGGNVGAGRGRNQRRSQWVWKRVSAWGWLSRVTMEEELEVAAGGPRAWLRGRTGRMRVVGGSADGYQDEASEPAVTAMEEEVTQVAMSAIQAIRSRNLLGTIY